MKYKAGDRIKIKSLDWYKENKDQDGIVELSTHIFTPGMSQFCGKVMTIEDVFEDIDDNVVYYMEEIDYDWTDEMIEGLVEEETKPKYEDEVNGEYYSTTKYLVRPNGYQFVDENGNVINATKIVLKKKKEYPKTYEECINELDTHKVVAACAWEKEMKALQTLLVCRDAYWKIAGEEMGLGKPWEPDWRKEGYIIYRNQDDIISGYRPAGFTEHHIFEFPTKEMRDAFYENFDPDIEICKELL